MPPDLNLDVDYAYIEQLVVRSLGVPRHMLEGDRLFHPTYGTSLTDRTPKLPEAQRFPPPKKKAPARANVWDLILEED